MYERANLPGLLGQEPGFPRGLNGSFELAVNVGAKDNVDAFFRRVTSQGATAVYAPGMSPGRCGLP
jgi:hypothetical protein